jgi:hypothetical protein
VDARLPAAVRPIAVAHQAAVRLPHDVHHRRQRRRQRWRHVTDRWRRPGRQLTATAAARTALARWPTEEKTMPTYRPRPITVDAIQYDGTNWHAVQDFTGYEVQQAPRTPVFRLGSERSIEIARPSGLLCIEPGTWIVREASGALRPMANEDFTAAYETA